MVERNPGSCGAGEDLGMTDEPDNPSHKNQFIQRNELHFISKINLDDEAIAVYDADDRRTGHMSYARRNHQEFVYWLLKNILHSRFPLERYNGITQH